MSDTEQPSDAPDVSTPAPAAPRSRGGLWLTLFLLLAAGLGGLYLWTELERARGTAASGEAWRLEAESLGARLDALDRRLQQQGADQRGIDGRIGEILANQRVIRQELLGTGERAATIEDAVARLSNQRLRGETTLKLNEIEGLLVLAEQRLELARDADGARLALRLAGSALEAVDDPLYAGLALPMRAELALLEGLPADPLPGLRAVLGDTLKALPALPRRSLKAEPASDLDGGFGSRLQQALASLVVVRKRESALDTLSGSARNAALEALQLDLRTALAAAEARDGAGLAAALARAWPLFEALFDPASAQVRGLSQRLRDLRPEALNQPLPDLGTSLAELRSLRGSRQRLPLSAPTTAAGVAADAAQPVDVEVEVGPEIELEPEPEFEASRT